MFCNICGPIEDIVKIISFDRNIPFKEAYRKYFCETKAEILKLINHKLQVTKKPVSFLAEKIGIKQAHLTKFLLGAKKISIEKLLELSSILGICGDARKSILNLNSVIELYKNDKYDLVVEILQYDHNFLSAKEVVKIQKEVNVNNLGKFFLASRLPHLKGDVLKIAEYLEMDIDEAIDLATALVDIGFLDLDGDRVKTKEEKTVRKENIDKEKCLNKLLEKYLSHLTISLLKDKDKFNSAVIKDRFIKTTREKYENYQLNSKALLDSLCDNLYDPVGDKVLCIKVMKYLID